MKGNQAVILHNQVKADAPKDELDVLVQAQEVGKALAELGYRAEVVPFSLDAEKAARTLRRIGPLFVFNLVESVDGNGQLIHLAPSLLDHLGLRYTGSGQEAIFVTSNKLLTKKLLRQAGVATPPWLEAPANGAGRMSGAVPVPGETYLLKSVWEHASNWLDEGSIVQAGSVGELRSALEKKNRGSGPPIQGDRGVGAHRPLPAVGAGRFGPVGAGRFGPVGAGRFGRFFAERYVEGREFNQAMLAGEFLPLSEIRFVEYPQDKLRVVDFRAKWEEESFEYTHTQRSFDFAAADRPLLEELQAAAGRCWDFFGLGGYARVDFRVDGDNRPWVLEINANPCLSPDSGFYAAAERSGLSFTAMVERIVDDCLSR